MDYYPRKNPNWIVSTLLFIFTLWVTNTYLVAPFVQLGAAISTALAGWALYNGVKSVLYVWLDAHERIRQAQTMTETVRMLELASHTHPDTLKLLFAERTVLWKIRAGIESPDNETYSVLYSAPDVTDKFVLYVLQNSSTFQLMPKRNLVDKSYKFDPHGMVSEYAMYDSFLAWLIHYRMTTEAGPSSPPQWISPWTPKMLIEQLGWEYTEDMGLQELE